MLEVVLSSVMNGQYQHILLMDGATGSELDRRGVDVSMPLWSARAMDEAPDVLGEVHQEYLEAGADAIITNTFRTHQRSLAKAGLGNDAERLTRAAVDIAREACRKVKPEALVFGGIAPLEDCYQPGLAPDSEACHREHGLIAEHLVRAGVDLVLLETMCSAREATAAAHAVSSCAPGRWGISFCLDSGPLPGVLLDGTPLEEIIGHFDDARFIGVNCVGAAGMSEQVRHLREMLGNERAIAAYANVGHADHEGGWVNTDAVDPDCYAELAMSWVEAGADIVGGCCGTRPATIRAMSNRLRNEPVEVDGP